MKNTKELFIRLYIGTLYSNFIVPLRGSNYTQLLYGGFQQGLVFLSERIRRLVWQGHINELGQISGRISAVFETNRLDQNLTETWLRLHQPTTKTLLENSLIEAKIVGQKLIKTWSASEAKNVPEVSLKCRHQTTTEIPPELAVKCRQKIGSIRVKSGQKIGANRCESVRILTSPGTKTSVNECKWMQKIGTIRDESGRNSSLKCDQMLPNATKNETSTYHYLILPNSSFMFCVGQK